MDKPGDLAPSQPAAAGPKPARRGRPAHALRVFRLNDDHGQRRSTEETLSQRLFAIILAVHAAEANLGADPIRLAAILELIHAQSTASLEDLRRLGALR